jgi:hypothetical protein
MRQCQKPPTSVITASIGISTSRKTAYCRAAVNMMVVATLQIYSQRISRTGW